MWLAETESFNVGLVKNSQPLCVFSCEPEHSLCYCKTELIWASCEVTLVFRLVALLIVHALLLRIFAR